MLELLKKPNVQKVILIVIILLLLFVTWKNYERAKSQEAVARQNSLALSTQIKTWKGKAQTYYTQNYILVSTIDSIERQYSKDIKDAEDRWKQEKNKGKIGSTTGINLSVNGLSGLSTNTDLKLDDKGFGLFSWKFENIETGYSHLLSGQTEFIVQQNKDNNDYTVNITPGKTMIVQDSMDIELYLFQIVNPDKSITVVGESKNPKLKIKSIKQIVHPIIIKEAVSPFIPEVTDDGNDWDVDLGFQIGIGAGANTLTFVDLKVEPVMYIGIGLSFNFLNLFGF